LEAEDCNWLPSLFSLRDLTTLLLSNLSAKPNSLLNTCSDVYGRCQSTESGKTGSKEKPVELQLMNANMKSKSETLFE
jgi:hypothetical protein